MPLAIPFAVSLFLPFSDFFFMQYRVMVLGHFASLSLLSLHGPFSPSYPAGSKFAFQQKPFHLFFFTRYFLISFLADT